MSHEQLQTKVTEILENVFKDSGVEYQANFENEESVTEDQVPVNKLFVSLKTTDDSLLIGYHGGTLASLQHLINIILFKSFGKEGMVILDVGEYKAERKKKILEVAESAIEKARALKKTIALYPMSSFERRLVHEKVSETDDLTSSSEGEGRDRRVIISFKE